MVEINEAERKKELNEMRTPQRPLRQCQTPQHLHYRAPRRRRQKGHEKIPEMIRVKKFPKMGKEIITQIQETHRVPTG